MLLVILLLLLSIHSSITETSCPVFCQCYSAFDGYHVTCQNIGLYEIPYNLTKYLQITEHQNLIIDLSSNFLSIVPCHFLQISTIITLILTRNKIESIPLCFSHSSIQTLLLNENNLQFNQTSILSSSKLLHLDLSYNKILHLPRTFFFHLRRLRRLILNGQHHLFQQDNNQWIRSLTTRNQLTIVICDENFHLPLCLFDYLFQSNKLLSIELNTNIHCDCSFVYLPWKKIHFQQCQSQQQEKCHFQSSRFEHGGSLVHLQTDKYRQLCAKEYQTCQHFQLNNNYEMTTSHFVSTELDLPLSNNSIELISLIKSSSINESITSTMVIVTSSKKENITAGAIIPFVLLLLVVTIVCLYVILSGHFFKLKNHEKNKGLIIKRKKQQDISSVTVDVNSDKNATRFDECIPIENINMNSNPKKLSFQSSSLHHQRRNSYSDDESELTFYSIINKNHSSTSFPQSSMTEIEITSLTSTINSSLSNETIIISNRIYS